MLPPGDFVGFRFFFLSLLRLVALCVSLWVGGVPLAAFSLPLASCGVSFLWVGGFPLLRFPCVFPVVLGGLGVVFCFFSPAISCFLRLLLRVG